jgi:hypothetical protein
MQVKGYSRGHSHNETRPQLLSLPKVDYTSVKEAAVMLIRLLVLVLLLDNRF